MTAHEVNNNNNRFYRDGMVVFNPAMTTHWTIFLYRISRILYKKNEIKMADYVYYLNKIMHSVDWFYEIKLPTRFLCEHPLGSVLGRASYGESLLVYQGTTVGGSRKKGEICYPSIGDNVILFANSSVIGNSEVGNNVMISAGTRIINSSIPSNSIVFGGGRNLIIKKRSEEEMKKMIDEYWR